MKSLWKIVVLLCLAWSFQANAATSSIVMDMETGEVISASNADELRYPASLTKMMTLYIAFTALENGAIKMEDELPVSRAAANRSPSKLGLKAGEKIMVKDVINALIVKSANDCATVMAEGLGYDEAKFAEAMTKMAKTLGMKNTTFKNASGLPNKAQKTTARDMAILSAAMYKHFPQYWDLFSLKKFSYNGREYRTHNNLLKTFEGADGLKTGYTAAAGYNIATSAEREGQRIVAVTMGHKTLKGRDQHVARIMDSSLNKLANIEVKEPKVMLASIVPARKPEMGNLEEVVVANVEEETTDGVWGIQLGAFSNYAKAKNYAKTIQKQNPRDTGGKNIEIDVAEVQSAIVYRSRIVGFSKEDANNFCNSLKRANKSCMVVAGKQLHLAFKK